MGSIPPCFFVSAAAPPSGAPCSWVAVIALVVFLIIACSVYYIILDSLLAHLKKHFFFTLIDTIIVGARIKKARIRRPSSLKRVQRVRKLSWVHDGFTFSSTHHAFSARGLIRTGREFSFVLAVA